MPPMSPMSPEDAYKSARGFYERGAYRAALLGAEKLFKRFPHHPPIVGLYVAVLIRLDRTDDGIRMASRALRHITNRDHRDLILTQLSDALVRSGRVGGALELLEEELDARPEHLGTIRAYAGVLLTNGQREEAIACIDQARAKGITTLGLASVFGQAALRTDRKEEAIEWLNAELGEVDSDDESTIETRYSGYGAVGHLLDACGRYDEAMAAFDACNALVDAPDHGARHAEQTKTIVERWTPERFVELDRPMPDDSGPRPVFIVGMPRSGTTLTEQILDCHPKVHGAGELGLINELFTELAIDTENRYATTPDQYAPGALAKAAKRYRDELKTLANDDSIEVVVDKAPLNFHFLGMIAAAFPDARIIHCTRDPRDTCLSCYFQRLSPAHWYSFDLANCGRYYRRYRTIVGHYRDLLSSDPIQMPMMENNYEQMVLNQEQATRNLLDFVGLEFDPACLRFQDSGRVATTLSNDQVRQAMYTSSTKRHEWYKEHIGPLIEALGDLL